MKRLLWMAGVCGILWAIGPAAIGVWAQPAKPKLERLRVAVAPLGWDTNFTWLNPRSGNLDKRPALEFLIGIDRHTGAYIPELAEKWYWHYCSSRWTLRLLAFCACRDRPGATSQGW